LGWSNGETFTALRAPRTGVVLPLQRTPVHVEREQLDITVARYETRSPMPYDLEYQVQATYWLHNPTNQRQTLKIAFPIPGIAIPRNSPVRLDNKLVEWQLMEASEFLELHRPQMHKVLTQILAKRKTLRTFLEQAWKRLKANPEWITEIEEEEIYILEKAGRLEIDQSKIEQEIALQGRDVPLYEIQNFWKLT